MTKRYDYIIAGAGCAGLSLAMHLIKSGRFANKKILLVDSTVKNANDRTWCFWEDEPGLFEPVVHKQWASLWFFGDGFYKDLSIKPYKYKMIRGIDFYNFCIDTISAQQNFEWLQASVDSVFSDNETGVVINGERIVANYVFNSILFEKPSLNNKHHWLLQHFKGWQIEVPESTFDTSIATMMDFRISQEHGTAFCYVLPTTDKTALVEYTLFTPSLLKEEEYEAGLKNYIENILHLSGYTVTDTEFGIIPMTNYRFQKQQGNVINIGTAGGQTKGSSGYTFYFIQQHCKRLVRGLANNGKPTVNGTSGRFPFYDAVLLQVLQDGELKGKDVFSTMFRKNRVSDILAFLNNDSSLLQEAKIISSLPTMPFFRAAVKQVF